MVTKNRVKWTMLWIYLISFVLVLALAGNASAVDKIWDAGGATNLWTDANNWDPNGVPTTDNPTLIDIVDANCLINVDANCFSLEDGNRSVGPCYLRMTGGTLTLSGGNLVVGDEPNGNGFLTMDGGTIKTGTSALWIAVGSNTVEQNPTYGTLIINDGDVNVGSKLILGKNKRATGKVYMYDGVVIVGDDIEIGNYGTGDFNMYGGDVNSTDNLKLAISGSASTGGTATIYIHDGNMHCDDLVMGTDTATPGTSTIYLYGGLIDSRNLIQMYDNGAKIDIYEGELRVGTDSELKKIQGYASVNKIVGYGGSGSVVITPAGGGIGYISVTALPGDLNLAGSASPGNYATVDWTPAGPTLSWSAGQYADNHDVYFGTNRNAVNDANNTSPEFKGNQDPCSYDFNTPPPVLGQTYYWRIDEVNDACDPCNWPGNLWQFTMAGYEVVESFNPYTGGTFANVWNLTGGGANTTISLETTTVRLPPGKSMKYKYSTAKATEAYAYTTGANKLPVDINDWTKADIKALVLYFYGVADNNTAEKMYVALQSSDNKSAVVYYDGDANDINKPEWHEWNIKLSDFEDINDVDLSDVNRLYIGFGTRGSKPNSDGNMYFDDIRLYPSRCRTLFAPVGDMSGPVEGGKDCLVNFYDVNVMTRDWLDTDADRKGSDGVLKGGASWVNDDDRGRCIQLDGLNGWVDLDDRDFSDFRNKTIAFWVKIVGDYSADYPYMFYFSDDKEGVPNPNPYRIHFMTYTPGDYKVRMRFIDTYSANFVAGQIWSFLAFVVEDTPGDKCTGKFYGYNTGQGWTPVSTITGQRQHSGLASGVNIGSENDGKGSAGYVRAVFDDFRVYDYNLSEDEVKYLAGTDLSTPPDNNLMLLYYDFNELGPNTVAHNSSSYVYYHPLNSPAELYDEEAEGQRAVDFKDFAILADNWLKEQLWP